MLRQSLAGLTLHRENDDARGDSATASCVLRPTLGRCSPLAHWPKRPAYLANGVAEVWLIDRDTRSIERWTAASEFPDTFQGSITWAPDPLLPPMVVAELELFGPSK